MGGETPEKAWNQNQAGSYPGDNGAVDMTIDDDKQQSCEKRMKVITGDDGRYIPVPNLNTQDYCIKIGLTLYKVQQQAAAMSQQQTQIHQTAIVGQVMQQHK